MSVPRLHVVAAVLQRDERYFIQQRQPGKHMAGLWEFPGGKIEHGEAAWGALARELGEELGITATRGEPLIQLTHAYPGREVHLDVWRVTAWDGQARALEEQITAWCTLDELRNLPLLPADGPVINAMALPHQVLVTPDCKTSYPEFLRQLESAIERNRIRLCILRQTRLAASNYAELARRVADVLETLGCRLVVHGLSDQTLRLAESVDAYGLHVTARTGMSLTEKPVGLQRLSMSCHSAEELRQASMLGANFALLGSVQPSASHPDGETLGWNEFKQYVAVANVPVFAIGGMRAEDEVRSRLEGGQGIAAISALWGRDGAERGAED